MKKKKIWSPNAYIKSHLRKIWRWSPQRRECLKANKCAYCGKRTTSLFADHIDPVADVKKGFQGWDDYIKRLFEGKLQPLCANCHSKKSKEENAERRRYKKLKEAKT